MVAAIKASGLARDFAETVLAEPFFRAVARQALTALLARADAIAGITPERWRRALGDHGILIELLDRPDPTAPRPDAAHPPAAEDIAALRAALATLSRDRAPLAWAATQDDLGNALQALGEREAGTARLEEAVAAHRGALGERTRDRAPLDWATTQANLGNALRALGERERHRPARGGGRRAPRRARASAAASGRRSTGPPPRTTSATRSPGSGSARPAPAGSRRPPPPTAPRSPSGPAPGRRSTGR